MARLSGGARAAAASSPSRMRRVARGHGTASSEHAIGSESLNLTSMTRSPTARLTTLLLLLLISCIPRQVPQPHTPSIGTYFPAVLGPMSPLADVVQSLGPNQRVDYQSAGDWLLATVTQVGHMRYGAKGVGVTYPFMCLRIGPLTCRPPEVAASKPGTSGTAVRN